MLPDILRYPNYQMVALLRRRHKVFEMPVVKWLEAAVYAANSHDFITLNPPGPASNDPIVTHVGMLGSVA